MKLNLKRITAFFIAAMTALCMSAPISVFADDDTEDPQLPAGSPYFTVYDNQSFTVQAGKVSNVNAYFINFSKEKVEKAYATITCDSKLGLKGNNVRLYSAIYPNEVDLLQLVFDVPSNTLSGSYNVDVSIEATNRDQVVSTHKLTYTINVKSDVVPNALDVAGFTVSNDKVKSGDSFALELTVKNNSGADIKDARIELSELSADKFAVDGGMNYVTADFKKDEEKKITFKLIAGAGLSSAREEIKVKTSYYINLTDKESLQSASETVTVSCDEASISADGKTFAPNIIIQSYTFGGDYAVGGKTFPLELVIKNTSSTATINNLKVTINGVAGSGENGVAFSPANSSNSFFFGALGAGQTETIKLDMLTKADAKPDSYPIEIEFDYEYTAGGKTDKATGVVETIRIPVQQDDRFAINSVDVSPECYIGDECFVSAVFVNKGKSAVYNVEAEVIGEGFTSSSSKLYIGNVNSGTEEYFDTTISPEFEGEITGTVIVRYEDANGNAKEITQDFTTYATQMFYGDDMMGGEEIPIDDTMGQPSSVMPVWVIILIVVGGAAITATAVIVIVIKVKRKKALTEAEDDDEDI